MNIFTEFWNRFIWLLSVIVYCSLISTAQAQIPTWTSVQRTTSTGIGSNSSGRSIAVAPDGSRYVTGFFAGTLTLGSITLAGVSGQGHVFLAKYSAVGTVLWATQFDGKGISSALAVDAAGNAYLTGTFVPTITFGSTALTTATLTTTGAFDAYLVKYNAQGVRQWVRQGGGDSVDSYSIAIDSNSNVVLAGDCQNSVSFGGVTLGSVADGSVYKAFYYKLSSAGEVLQAKQVSTRGDVNVYSVALDKADNVYFVGQFAGNATFGTTTITAIGTDLFLCKLDATGTVIWVQRDGSADFDIAESVTLDATGNPVVCGHYGLTSSGKNNIYVARFSAQGTLEWASRIPLNGARFENSAHSIVYDGRGGYFVTGSFVGTAIFGATTLTAESTRAQLFIARYDNQGSVLWAEKVTGSNPALDTSSGNGLVIDAGGTGYLTGSTAGTATFGALTTVSTSATGATDSFIATFTLGSKLGATNPASPHLTLQAYPNPAVDKTTILLPLLEGKLVVCNALGQIVYQQLISAASTSCTIPLGGLSPGLYQVRTIFSNGQNATIQLIFNN